MSTGSSEITALSSAPSGHLRLALLGQSTLTLPDSAIAEPVVLKGGKPLALLTYLHCSPAHTVSRDQLLELLWSDTSPEKGRHTLRQTFWYIRQKLGVDPFTVVGDSIRLAITIPSDRDAFLAALDADDPETAVRLYTGDFFPDFAAPGGAEFEQWADLERSRLRALYLGAATRVVRDRLAKGRARDAITVARRVHDLASRQQVAWRLLLESYLAADDTIGAAVELERLERWLSEDELEPEPATLQLIKSARVGRSHGQEADVVAEANQPTGLRAELVGRESEFSELLAATDAAKRGQSRHVHVSAAAGHGKTRLLEGFAARLRATRTRVATVRATPAERSLPYACAAQLVAALTSMRGASAVSPDTARTLVALAPASSSYLNAEPDKSTGDEALRRRSLALSELVATIAHDAPLVILVDDVHWMDAQSRTVLASLATRLANASVLLVTAARSNDRWADETPSAQRRSLAPLTADDVGALVMSIGQLPAEPWTDAFVRALHSGSKGSPLLVLETLQLVMERDQLRLSDGSWSTSDAQSLISTLTSGRVLHQRISALPPEARDALLRLAVAGIGLDEATLPDVLPADGRDALSLLETRGLVTHVETSWRVAHDEIADIAIEMAPNADRVRANEAIAVHLERSARDDVSMLLRAAWHRARTNDPSALDRVFARAVRSAHLSGEQAAIRSLGREVLGPTAETVEIERLVSRLPWRVRHRRGGWLGSSVLLASFAMLLIALYVSREPRVEVGPTLLTLDVASGDSTVFLTLPDIAGELSTDSPIDLVAVDAPIPREVLQHTTIIGRLDDGSYIGDGIFNNDAERGMDVVRVSPTGRVSPLFDGPHDQAAPVVSPDGRRVAFSTGALHPAQRAEIMVYEGPATPLRRVTSSDAKESHQVWSIEGTRLAFLQSPASNRRARICWTTIDTIAGACHTLADTIIPVGVAGWRSDDELLVVAEHIVSLRRMLVRVSVTSGHSDVIDASGFDYRVDPSGRVVLCVCEVAGYPEPVLAAFSSSSPSIKRALRFNNQPLRRFGSRFTVWTSTTLPLTAIDAADVDTAPPNSRARLTVTGFDAARRQRSVPIATWRSLDTSVVITEDSGYIRTLAEGQARVVVSAGGVLSDTVTVVVRKRPMTVVWRENWRSRLEDRWIPFGDPPSSIVDGSLQLRGDGYLTSGVISTGEIDPRAGAGAEVLVRLPLTEPQWQSIGVSFGFVAPTESLRSWSARDDGLQPMSWAEASAPRMCQFGAPRAEGGEYMRLSSFAAADRPVAMDRLAPIVSDGKWHRIVLQVFGDGRCALAIDGSAIAVSKSALKLDRPFRVLIEGRSVRTTVEAGSIEVWTGVRAGIDWDRLEHGTRAPERRQRPIQAR